MENPNRAYIAEFLGTFTLVFVGTSVATLTGFLGFGNVAWLGISLAFGFTLMVLVLVIGPASGCHVNPAVTIPMAIAGRTKWEHVPGYLLGQLGGALVASSFLLILMKGFAGYDVATHGLGANGNPQGMNLSSLLLWELIMTAFFVFTIFSATRPNVTPAVSGLAIGGFLLVAHLIGVPLGDASLNPARSFGPAILQGGDALRILWVFILAPVVGGWLGYGMYKMVYED